MGKGKSHKPPRSLSPWRVEVFVAQAPSSNDERRTDVVPIVVPHFGFAQNGECLLPCPPPQKKREDFGPIIINDWDNVWIPMTTTSGAYRCLSNTSSSMHQVFAPALGHEHPSLNRASLKRTVSQCSAVLCSVVLPSSVGEQCCDAVKQCCEAVKQYCSAAKRSVAQRSALLWRRVVCRVVAQRL